MKEQTIFLLVFFMLITTISTAFANDHEKNQASNIIIYNEVTPMILLETLNDTIKYHTLLIETGVARLDNRAGVNPARI